MFLCELPWPRRGAIHQTGTGFDNTSMVQCFFNVLYGLMRFTYLYMLHCFTMFYHILHCFKTVLLLPELLQSLCSVPSVHVWPLIAPPHQWLQEMISHIITRKTFKTSICLINRGLFISFFFSRQVLFFWGGSWFYAA